MNGNSVLFHIARQAGLEFVFTSGHALKYPLHTHVSVYTITIVRKGVVRLSDGRTTRIFPTGSTYVVVPHEAHSPAYSDNFDIVSLCVDKTFLANARLADALALCARHARRFVNERLLSNADAQAIIRGVETAHAKAAAAPAPAGTAAEALLSRVGAFASPYQFIRRFKRETGLTPHQYVIQDRVRQAKKALASRLPIVQAANLAGFYDQSHLNRWFNRSIGITPAAYAESCFLLDD